jgi:hypothetical protein
MEHLHLNFYVSFFVFCNEGNYFCLHWLPYVVRVSVSFLHGMIIIRLR